ncbi:MAG: glycerol-3-phosphate 1-O-acyltransferase PlsY [Desulfatirhabdiaceae bacterium]
MTFKSISYIIVMIILAYLAGSIPFGLILTRWFSSADVLTSGSGNIGATNVRRVAGTGLGILTLFLDGLKGTLPVYAADMVSGMTGGLSSNDLAVTATALAAFCGHLYPVYMTGRHGGKGVATAFGCFLVISPAATGTCMLIYVAGLLLSAGKSSVGSLLAAASLPVVLCFFRPSPVVIIGSVFMMVMIFFRHQDNIRRLINDTEPSL